MEVIVGGLKAIRWSIPSAQLNRRILISPWRRGLSTSMLELYFERMLWIL
jgi:hypothetical protein